MLGYRFTQFEADKETDPFKRLLNIFLELLNYTAGDVYEAINWMNELDKEHKLTNQDYTMADFIEDLKKEELPREYYQFTAGAIINYELTRRRSFKILIEKEPLLDFLKQGPEKHIYRITKRTMSPEKHEQIADGCSRLKDKIYEEHEKLSKRK